MKNYGFKNYFKERLKNKVFVIIICIYILICLSSAIYFCVNWQARNFFMSLGFTLFAPLIFIVEYLIDIRCGELFTAAVLFMAFGSILGSCYNVYTTIPFFDTFLHGLSGVLFGCLGFGLAERFFGKAEDKKSFFGCLFFAVCFSLAIAVIWEIFEYACNVMFGFDMEEDSFVYKISSYLLAGSHTETVEIDGITKTVIYYGDGLEYVIDGYLDLGLIDTLTDMIICLVGTLAFGIIAIISYFKFPKINAVLIPQTVKNPSKEKE